MEQLTMASDQEDHSESNLSKSDSFQKPSKLITKIISQSIFDKSCMVLAEVIGTGALTFLGCMGTLSWGGISPGIATPINFGLTVMIIIQTFGHISFAILNPAVTICAVINRLISVKMAILYMVAQLVGASLGFGLLRLITPEEILSAQSSGACMTLIHPSVSVTKGFFIEFFLTCALITMICGVWDPRNRNNGDSAPLRIGLGIIALSIAGGPYTDASMNPARSFGPALWNWNWENHWVFWVAPLCAGLIASVFYKVVFWRNNPDDKK